MTEPDDRELEQYLTGDSRLSRRYRDASTESAPPELDEAVLAQARAELRRKPPSLNRYLAPVALAASVLLGVNLAWNLYQAEPVPAEMKAVVPQSRDNAFVPSPPPAAAPAQAPSVTAAPAPERKQHAASPPPVEQRLEAESGAGATAGAMARPEAELAAREEDSMRKAEARQREPAARQQYLGPAAAAPAESAADAAAPLPEAAKIDRLIAYVASLQGAVFVRNGKDYGPDEAAKHLQYKREKAGDRVKTADDFIRLCASHSYVSGDAYLIRFADGRTRTAEDVLREELARM